MLAQAQKRQSSTRVGSQRQSLLTESQKQAANGSPIGDGKGSRKGARSEFARRAAEIGRGITSTMEKLGRLAECTLDFPSVLDSRSAILAGADVLSAPSTLWLTIILHCSSETENLVRRSAG